ncbi:hypothetical protein QUA20_28645 [Microcoleus sp. Pol7_A1]|uniref:hypothetical protein n=1 Tax=Microcoleus sp. Pol7_A1 TaxID=2818893 RepID=UPI002FD13511
MSAPLYNITKNNNPSESLVLLGAVRYGSEKGESARGGERYYWELIKLSRIQIISFTARSKNPQILGHSACLRLPHSPSPALAPPVSRTSEKLRSQLAVEICQTFL